MRARAGGVALAALVAACSGGAGAQRAESPAPADQGGTAAPGGGELTPGVDPTIDPEELRVAAIERAMNLLSPAAHICWAAGAADDFKLAGEVRVLVSLDDKVHAKAQISKDATGDKVLTDCLIKALEGYPWPSALAGEAVELPFAFGAPHGQNVIDRRFVPAASQAGAEIGVLLDEKNSGNGAASMIAVVLAPGASLPLAPVARDEAWYFVDPVRISGPDGKPIDLGAGDAAYLKKGAFRAVTNPGQEPARMFLVGVPGGAEGTARAGALPVGTGKPTRTGPGPEIVRRAEATRYPRTGGATTIYLENVAAKKGKRPPARSIALDLLEIDAGIKVPPHRHDEETEMLYLLSGSGTLVVDGVELQVGATSTVQIPPNVEHSFSAAEPVQAIQIYVPPGPEQRFKKMK